MRACFRSSPPHARLVRYRVTQGGLQETTAMDIPVCPVRLTERDRQEAEELFEELFPHP